MELWIIVLSKIIWSNVIPAEGRVSNAEKSTTSQTSVWILLATSVLALLPVWIPSYPPMVDLPQHAAQVALLHNLQNADFAYSALFHLNWFTPYLLGYLLIYLFTPLFGIIAACKLVVSLFVVGFPLSTALLLRSVDVDVFWAILCIPCTYGFAYQWGFLNFVIAAPLGIVFFWFVMRSPPTPPLRSATLLAISTIGLFFCHALICAFFGICAVLYLLAVARSVKATAIRIMPLTAVLPIALLWVRRTLSHPAAKRPIIWDLNWHDTVESYYASLSQELHFTSPGWGRVSGFFPRLLGVTPSWRSVCIGMALFLLPFCAGLRFHKRLAMWMPFLLCIAVLLWCPHAVFGTEFVYQRFTMFAVPLFLLLLREPSVSPKMVLAIRSMALALVVVLIASAAQRAVAFSRETRGFQEALSHMQPGQRVLSLVFDHEDGISIAPTFLHFPSWYAAQKQGVVDPSAAMMHPELVVYRPGRTPDAVLWDFEWHPDEFSWNDYSGEQYHYFVVRSVEDVGSTLFSQAPCAVNMRFHQEEWWLYERAADCQAVPERATTTFSQQ